MTVAIIGLGLIGGSIGLDLVAAGTDVVGVDPDPDTRKAATSSGIRVADLPDAVVAADLVVVATPPGAVARVIHDVVAHTDTPITDVASVCDPAALGLGGTLPPAWIGSHPMAGTERSGFAAARRGLLVGAPWLVTPHDASHRAGIARVLALALDLQARPIVVTPTVHDELVATVSHLPHLLAFGLQQGARDVGGDVVAALAGPSFRDATRVAASDPVFWADLLDRNAAAVQVAVDRLRAWLDRAVDEDTTGPQLADQLAAARRRPGPREPDAGSAEVVDLAADDALDRLRTAGRHGRPVIGVATVSDLVVHLAPPTHR